ncbi:TMEM175 family protein [Halomarina rubra]|uniref:TMEM175 family protein n=1 Tax=Halomarina rubra TaxID=2071873 RepID=A0ABD6AQJ5_9EURY|nr:TMEM175 family protein [Halomarina rubra]
MATDRPPVDPTRLVALSDGVFAIAITVLVLNVDLPSEPARTAVTETVVIGEWRDVFSYVLSFLVIGNFWVDHRHVFDHVTVHTQRVTWLNMVFLMSVAFLPFPTALLGDDGGVVSVVFYAVSMTVTGALLYVLWWYVSRHDGHLVSGISPDRARLYGLQYLLTPLAFGLSIPAALFVDPALAFVCWGLLFVSLVALKVSLEGSRYGRTDD